MIGLWIMVGVAVVVMLAILVGNILGAADRQRERDAREYVEDHP